MTWPRILVTGATGFIGGWIVDTLCKAGAEHAAAGVRHPSPRLDGLPANLVHCDVRDRASLDKALAGIEVVIHCARDPDAMVEGTRNLLEAIRAAGVRRLVQMSSVSVYGDATGVVTEDSPPAPIDGYGAAKVEEEKLCRAAAGPDLTIAVIRPSLV
jgi:2-alkyl-3-oxoalkanoate reductase